LSTQLKLIGAPAAVEVAVRIGKCGEENNSKSLPIIVENLKKAELEWWLQIQSESFPEETFGLKRGYPVRKKSRLAQFSVFHDTEGVIQLRRVVNNSADLRQETNHHRQIAHHGRKRVINTLGAKDLIMEYVPSLLKKEKWLKTSSDVAAGGVVFVLIDQLPRNNWPKGIIEGAFPRKDGVSRVVDVQTTSGTYRRPVAKISPLNIRRRSPADLHGGRNVAEADEDHPASTEQNSVSVPQEPTKGYGGRKTKEEGEEDRVRRGFISR